MADIWSGPEWQSDKTPPPPSSAGKGGDLWGDEEWKPDQAHTEPATFGSVARQFPVGFNEGLADVAGAPVDLAKAGLQGMGALENKIVTGLGGKPLTDPYAGVNPVGGSESIKSALGVIGADPRATPAQNAPERIVRGTGGGVAAMVGPEAILGVLGKVGALTPEIAAKVSQYFGASSKAGDVASSAAVGGLSGGTGEAAAEVAPEPLKPVARVMGNVFGGGLGVGAITTAREVPTAVQAGKDFIAPLTKGGQAKIAAEAVKPTQELRQVQPTGEPTKVADTMRQSLTDIDAQTSAALDHTTQQAQATRDAIGGTGTPEEHGSTLRAKLQEGEDTARAHESGLWQAIDPEGTIIAPVAPVQKATAKVYGDMTAAAQASMTAGERKIVDVINGYEGNVPFRELADLRSTVSAELRNELRTSGRTPAYARLSQLRSGIEDSLSDVVEEQAGRDAQAVARGELSPDQAMAAKVKGWTDAWQSERAAVGGDSEGSRRATPGRTTAVSGVDRTARQGGVGPSSVAGDQGIQGGTPFDQAAKERLADATAATRERVATYGKPSGPVGQVLRPAGERGQYQVPTSAVGKKIFTAGPGGFENVQAFRRATSDPEAFNTLQDHVASQLVQKAGRADGTLDPAKTADWLKAHSEAMRAFPELAGKFQDAASASSSIEDIAAIRKQSLDDMQRGTFGKLIGATNDEDVTRIVGNTFNKQNSVQEMHNIFTQVRGNSDAENGLRKAVVDYMYNHFVTDAPGKGQSFVRQNHSAIRAAGFSESELDGITRIAADIDRSQGKIKQLTTAEAPKGSWLSEVFLAGMAAAKHGTGGIAGAVAGVAGKVLLSRFRAAGFQKAGDLVKQAMLDPELARRLIAQIPKKAIPRQSLSVANLINRYAIFPSQQSSQQQSQ